MHICLFTETIPALAFHWDTTGLGSEWWAYKVRKHTELRHTYKRGILKRVHLYFGKLLQTSRHQYFISAVTVPPNKTPWLSLSHPSVLPVVLGFYRWNILTSSLDVSALLSHHQKELPRNSKINATWALGIRQIKNSNKKVAK